MCTDKNFNNLEEVSTLYHCTENVQKKIKINLLSFNLD